MKKKESHWAHTLTGRNHIHRGTTQSPLGDPTHNTAGESTVTHTRSRGSGSQRQVTPPPSQEPIGTRTSRHTDAGTRPDATTVTTQRVHQPQSPHDHAVHDTHDSGRKHPSLDIRIHARRQPRRHGRCSPPDTMYSNHRCDKRRPHTRQCLLLASTPLPTEKQTWGPTGHLPPLHTTTTTATLTHPPTHTRLEALAVDDGGAGLVVLGLGDPHGLERRQRRQDGAANPH